ncbi:MAG: transketolase [Spirochaetia bacterium]|nr:transketolase [Spirochaetia bacterium]
MSSNWHDDAKRVAAGIRRRVLEHTINNNGGYLSQACSSAEILAALYTGIMNLGKPSTPLIPKPFPGVPGPYNKEYFTGGEFNGPHTPEYDRFILSPSQYALVLYACLIETGRMDESGLKQFNKDGSSVEMIGAEHSPGMEVTNGSLGQALSQAAGIALAKKMKKEAGHIWVFMSDGELQIGQTWEAFQFMVYHRLDNMTVYVDVNGYQCDGKMTSVMSIEPAEKRFESFGCTVTRINGHDLNAIEAAAAAPHTDRPLVVLCDTNPCEGLPLLKIKAPKFHYLRMKNEEEHRLFAEALNNMKGLPGGTAGGI